MAYSEEILNEFFNTENVGVIKGADGVGKIVCPECGAIMKIYLLIEKDTIKEATYQTYGCVAAIASCQVATKMLIGKTIDEAEKTVNEKAILKALGKVDESKKKFAKMAAETVVSALKSLSKKSK